MRGLARLVSVVVLTALGLVAGVAGSFFHPYAVGLLGASIPVGVLAALAGAAGAFVLAGVVTGNRLAVLGPGVGWLLPALAMSVPRPEGDLVVSASAKGYAFLLGGAITLGLAVALPYDRPGRRAGSAPAPPEPAG